MERNFLEFTGLLLADASEMFAGNAVRNIDVSVSNGQ